MRIHPYWILLAFVAAMIVFFIYAGWFIDRIFQWGSNQPRSAGRRHIMSRFKNKSRDEIRFEAMKDLELEAWLGKHPRDPTAAEIWCERLKGRGDWERYATAKSYFLSIDPHLSVEEASSFYHELASVCLEKLGRPARAREALNALVERYPRSYQATLARERMKRIEEMEEGD
jgi:hypothetical protein